MANLSGQYGNIKGEERLVTHVRHDIERNLDGVSDDIRWIRDNRICTTAGYGNFSYSQSVVLNSGMVNYSDDITLVLTRYDYDKSSWDTSDTRRVRERGGWFVEKADPVFPT